MAEETGETKDERQSRELSAPDKPELKLFIFTQYFLLRNRYG